MLKATLFEFPIKDFLSLIIGDLPKAKIVGPLIPVKLFTHNLFSSATQNNQRIIFIKSDSPVIKLLQLMK